MADILFDKVKEVKENLDLRNELSDYLKQQKEEFDHGVFEYDFDALMHRIEASLLNETTLRNLTAVDPEIRNRTKERIRISCVQAALSIDGFDGKESYDTSNVEPITQSASYCLHLIAPVHESEISAVSENEEKHKSDTYELAEIDPIHVTNRSAAQQKVEGIVNQLLNIIVEFL